MHEREEAEPPEAGQGEEAPESIPRPNRHNRRAERVKDRKASKPHAFTDVRVTLSGQIDLIDNAEDTRRQLGALSRLRAPRPDKMPVASAYVDISGVTFIEPVALVYLAAELDRLTSAGVSLTGNYPRARGPLQLLRDAGFEEFLRIPQHIRLSESSGPKVKLMSGAVHQLLAPHWWMPLYQFMTADGALSPDEADELYNALNEMIENVRQHAYRRRGGKWYGVALRADASRPGRIVVVDLGRGITRSLGRLHRSDYLVLMAELMQAFFAETSRWNRLIEGGDGLDGDLLESMKRDEWTRVWAATQGFRNRTRGPGRGTGLSGLRTAVEKSHASALHVLSGTACVSYLSGRKPKHVCLPSLRGTAVCLDIGRPQAAQGT